MCQEGVGMLVEWEEGEEFVTRSEDDGSDELCWVRCADHVAVTTTSTLYDYPVGMTPVGEVR